MRTRLVSTAPLLSPFAVRHDALVADMEVFSTAWYFAPDGELRECLVVEANALGKALAFMVIDTATEQVVSVAKADVIIQPE